MSIAAAPSLPVITSRWRPWLGLAVGSLLVAWLYAPLAHSLTSAWSHDDNYSHGPLVVLAAVGLAIRSARRTSLGWSASAAAKDRAFGIAMLVVALLLHGAAWLLNFTLLDVVSLVTLLLAVLLTLGGQPLRRALGFPVLLLLFAAPLPVAWYQPLALGLQQLVSGLAATIFSLCGLSVYREGYVIHLSGMALEVGAACSGMRQLTAYLALGAVMGHLAGRGRRFTAAVMALAAVMAVAANLLRILLTGVLMLVAGPESAAGVFHTLEGLATLAIGAVGLLLAATLLARFQDRRRERNGASHRFSKVGAFTLPAACAVPLRLLVLALLGAAALAQGWAQRAIDANPAPRAAELAGALSQLPRQLGPWQGTDAQPPADIAWADQFVRRDYRHRQTGQVVVVWIAYSPAGADRAHHPEVCMDVAGRSEDRSRRSAVSLPGGAPIAELVFGQSGEALTTWYWHYALPETQAAGDSALAQAYHRARRRRASVTAELISSDGSTAGRAAARQLVALVDAALRPLLPADSVRGSQRLPVGVTAEHRTQGTDRTIGHIRPIGSKRPIHNI